MTPDQPTHRAEVAPAPPATSACGPSGSIPEGSSFEIDASAAAALVASGHAILHDVRDEHEWDLGHAPPALHHPLRVLDPALAPPAGVDNGATSPTLILVSGTGRRSAEAAAQLSRAGIAALNLTDGMSAWSAARLPVTDGVVSPRHGRHLNLRTGGGRQ